MTPSPDLLYTVLSCASLASVGALAIAVLPWTDEEVNASWSAWATVGTLVKSVLKGLRTPRHAVTARVRALQ